MAERRLERVNSNHSSAIEPLKEFLQRWIITTLAVLVAAHVVRGIAYDSVAGLLVASLLLGILNAFLRPFMLLLSLPLLVASFGLFILVINAVLLYFVGWLVEPFRVESWWAAFWGGIVISLISMGVNLLAGDAQIKYTSPPRRRRSSTGKRRSIRNRGPSDGDGPVIDV